MSKAIGNRARYEFAGFPDGGVNKIGAKNGDVRIRLYFEDGSMLDLLLQP